MCDYNIHVWITIVMSHLFISMNFIRFHKYYADVLSTKDILAINNLLAKSWITNILWMAVITTFTAKSYPGINILFHGWPCGSATKGIEKRVQISWGADFL